MSGEKQASHPSTAATSSASMQQVAPASTPMVSPWRNEWAAFKGRCLVLVFSRQTAVFLILKGRISGRGVAVRSVACSGALGYCSLRGGLCCPRPGPLESQTRPRAVWPGVHSSPVLPFPLIDKIFIHPTLALWIYLSVPWSGIQGLQEVLQRVPEQPEENKCSFKFSVLYGLAIYLHYRLNKCLILFCFNMAYI